MIPDGGFIWAETYFNPWLNNWQYLRCDRQCVCLLSSNKISKYALSDVASRPATVMLWRKYVHANFGYVSKLTWRSSKFIFSLFVFKLSNGKRKGTLHLRSPGHLHNKFVLEHCYREKGNSPKTLCMCAYVKSTRSWAVCWLVCEAHVTVLAFIRCRIFCLPGYYP